MMALESTADPALTHPLQSLWARPLAPIVASFCVAIFLAEWSAQSPRQGIAVISALAFVGLGLAFCFGRARRLWLSAAGMLVLGYGYALWSAVYLPANQISRYAGSAPATLEGQVLSTVTVGPGRTRLDLTARVFMRDATVVPVSGRVRLTGYDFESPVEPGDVVRVHRLRVRRPGGFRNPGAFDYGRYLARRGIHATGSIGKVEQIEIVQRSSSLVLERLSHLKARLAGRIEAVMDEAEAAITKEMVLGVRGPLPAPVRETFNASGTVHLLSVSGFHVAAVYGATFFLLRFLFKQIRFRLLWRMTGGPRPSKLAAVCALTVVMAYACFITLDGLVDLGDPNFPAIRSTIMITTFVLAYLLDRDGDPINITLLAAFAILLLSPFALFGIGFQLSFAGVLMIFYAHRLLCPWRDTAADQGQPLFASTRLKGWLRDAAVISVFASLGTLPLVLYHFERLPLVAPLANIAVAPVASIAVPLAIVASFTSELLPGLGSALLTLTGMTVHAMYALIRAFAALPYAAPHTGAVALPVVLLAYATVLLLPYGRHHRLARWGTLAGALMVSIWLTWPWLFPAGRGQLQVTFLDVGHGDASFIRFPQGTTMLIDGGGSYRDDVDIGERVVAPFLRHHRVRQVDYVAATHAHPDHARGLGSILQDFRVQEFWDNGAKEPALWYRLMRQRAVERGIYRQLSAGGSALGSVDGVRLDLLHPSVAFQPRVKRRGHTLDADENNRSLVLKLTYGGVSFLFTGDIEQEAERFLLQSHGNLQSTILKVPHHGSRTSSSAAFVHAVNPRVVVFSVQRDSRFGHPHASVVERYREHGAHLLRTDVHGAISLRTDGRAIWIEPLLGEGLELPESSIPVSVEERSPPGRESRAP
jgi:competence protein ComEC